MSNVIGYDSVGLQGNTAAGFAGETITTDGTVWINTPSYEDVKITPYGEYNKFGSYDNDTTIRLRDPTN